MALSPPSLDLSPRPASAPGATPGLDRRVHRAHPSVKRRKAANRPLSAGGAAFQREARDYSAFFDASVGVVVGGGTFMAAASV
jgi:hypothetical protein